MGTRSDFYLTVFDDKGNPPPEFEAIMKTLEAISGYKFEVDGEGSAHLYDSKWYADEDDLRIVSADYPGIRFEMSATSDEDYHWILNALDGVVIHRAGSIIYEPNTLWKE